jgi:RNase P subunit RPR2
VTTHNANHLFNGPTQPDLPTRCPSCHAFLKRTWDHELVQESRNRWVTVWYTTCKACGETVKVEL